MRAGHRTIAFCRSRKGTELVAAEVRRRLGTSLGESVRPYRGGYLAAERREIERQLFTGELRGVVATTALELGIDVGGLDACVLNGFPGTIASLWQQAGRAGREAQASIAALVAGDDQLDQWFMTHPEELFTRPPEPAVVNPSNPHVLLPHLACAAYELPLTPADERWWPDLLDDGVRRLVLGDRLRIAPPSRRRPGPTAVWAGRGWPAHGVGLRDAGGDELRIAEPDGTLVGTVDGARGLRTGAPGGHLPPPGPGVAGDRPRPRRPGRLRRAERRGRVHPAPHDHRDPRARHRRHAGRSGPPSWRWARCRSARRSSATAASTPSPASSSACTTSTSRRASW